MNISEKQTLTREQKEAIGLLSIGTFLEYFDLMLYVHMAVLLNGIFFPKFDAHSAPLFAAAAFCSTYAFRPLGALLFGWIGDNIGRKHTVVATTLMMAVCCIIMAALPSYAEIGITASWAITILRIIQGISSVSEITGSQLYLTEITKPPVQYQAVASIMVFATFGSVFALGIGALCSSCGFNWRIAFLIGAGIAFIGTYARSALRETPEFVDAKLKFNKISIKLKDYKKNIRSIYLIKIFDRLHNMQTIGFQSFAKQRKIAEETVLNIIPITFYLEIPRIEGLLTDICSKILSPSFASKNFDESEFKKKVLKVV
jgi:MHS family proline/betaine transporter-like MFS transporter